ncbi:MAG: germination protein YpeB [Ruminococcaceae bacterium]|nr:germination protein YpeB [Oscillospiraceae bacterium]
MEKLFKNKNTLRAGLTVLSIAAAFFIAATVFQTFKVRALSQQTENHYMAAFSDLCDYMDNIDVYTKKILLAKGEKQISALATQIYMETAAAKTNLSQLPLSDINLDNTSKFLVQTGDYMMVLSTKVQGGEEISQNEFENISVLSEYAEKLSGSLEELRGRIYSGEITFSQSRSIMSKADEKTVPSEISGLENEFMEYPSLIYDGPFSDHMTNKTSDFLKYKGQITGKMALRSAEEYLGKDRAQGLNVTDEGGGAIETYILSKNEKDKNFQIAITKQGSKILWMLDSRDVGKAKIDLDDARRFAKAFLIKAGYNDMTESYYEEANNIATLNYAYEQDGVKIYSDLIKVKVALDNGEILGIEATGYLMNHKEREFEGELIGEEEAKKRAGTHLSVTEINLAVIPLESGTEVLCYELKGAFDDRNYLIYVNAKTGEDEKILLLLESDSGILTV